ncbi:MAG: alpha/beta hydrolase [Anaerolineaceae bacterium]|nr:alpha/beta hydrolase [Anaerolineaceae bacterium]
MNPPSALTLDPHDPQVVAALQAEERLFDYYGLSAQTHFVTLPRYGLRMRISEIGRGQPILVVPGNTGEVFPLAPLLAELYGRRIIALNRPGGGGSDGMDHRQVDLREFAVETLSAVMDAFQLERVPILAHSFGGHWSLWLALDHPQRVSALALLGVPGNLLTTCPPLALRLTAVPGLNRLLYGAVLPRSPEQALKGLSMVGHSPETIARLPVAMADCYYYFQSLPYARLATLSLMEKANRLRGSRPEIRLDAGQLRRVEAPAAFLWGTQDPFGSLQAGRQIAGLLPQAGFYPIQGAGHLPWLDAPAECDRLAREFLAGY